MTTAATKKDRQASGPNGRMWETASSSPHTASSTIASRGASALRHAHAAARSATSQDAEPTIASSPVIGPQNNAWSAGCNIARWSGPSVGRF